MNRKIIATSTAAGVLLLGAGYGIGSSAGHAVTVTKDVAVTKNVPGPVRTVTKTVTKNVPGPTVYKTKYVPASQGPTGTMIADYSGSGNQNTGSFQAPASGDYIVKWTYSGDNDGTGSGGNFAISATDNSADAIGLPNDIGFSGSGSTEVTSASGTESFNVQESAGSWTVTVISAA